MWFKSNGFGFHYITKGMGWGFRKTGNVIRCGLFWQGGFVRKDNMIDDSIDAIRFDEWVCYKLYADNVEDRC